MAQILGTKAVLANMKKKFVMIQAQHVQGLKAGGLVLQAASQKQVPVDHGVLKASAFTRKTGTGFGTNVNVGYTAFYAPFVHEAKMVLKGQERTGEGAKGRYWDPQGRAKSQFLAGPMVSEKTKILKVYQRITGRGY